MTGAVGMITETAHANEIITGGDADMVFLRGSSCANLTGRSDAQHELGVDPTGQSRTGTRFGGAPGESLPASAHPRSTRKSSTRACSNDSPCPSAKERCGIRTGAHPGLDRGYTTAAKSARAPRLPPATIPCTAAERLSRCARKRYPRSLCPEWRQVHHASRITLQQPVVAAVVRIAHPFQRIDEITQLAFGHDQESTTGQRLENRRSRCPEAPARVSPSFRPRTLPGPP